MTRRMIIGLVAVLIIAVLGAAAAIYYDRYGFQPMETDQPLAPKLADQLNRVATIVIEQEDRLLHLTREDDGSWSVVERAGYAADYGKVKQLLLALSESKQVERKTAKADQHVALGLDSGSATRLRLYAAPERQAASAGKPEAAAATTGSTDADEAAGGEEAGNDTHDAIQGTLLLDVWLGDYAQARKGTYVRREGQDAGWLATGKLEAQANPARWLEKNLADIGRERIRQVSIAHPDALPIIAGKNSSSDRDFALQQVPEGRTVSSQYAVNNLAYALERLQLKDVKPEGTVEFTPEATVRSRVQSFDGLDAEVMLTEQEGSWWAAFTFEYNPALVEKAQEGDAAAPADAAANVANAPVAATEGAGAEAEDVAAQQPQEEDPAAKAVREQITALQRRTTGWVFALPEHKATLLVSGWGDVTQDAEDE